MELSGVTRCRRRSSGGSRCGSSRNEGYGSGARATGKHRAEDPNPGSATMHGVFWADSAASDSNDLTMLCSDAATPDLSTTIYG